MFPVLGFLLPGLLWAQVKVRVLTYNIERGIGSGSTATAAQPYLAKMVNYLNPDIWTVQELGSSVNGWTAAANTTALTTFIGANLTIFGPNPQAGVNYHVYVGTATDGYIGQAIVSRYALTQTQTYTENLRGLTVARATLANGQALGVFTAHLKALSGSSNAGQRQTQAMNNAARVTSWMAANPGKTVVVTGDFNETEEPTESPNYTIGATVNGSQVYRPITMMMSPGLLDPRPLSIKGKWATISSTTPNARFDYLLYANGTAGAGSLVFDTKQHTAAQLAALNSASGTTFAASDMTNASDHLPALLELVLPPIPPQVATLAATGVTSYGATLKGTLNANGLSSTAMFDLGPTASYAASSATVEAGTGTVPQAVSLTLTGLLPATTYHYRIAGQNSAGNAAGGDLTFTTAALVDSDGDGMADDYETAHGFDPDSGGDAALDSDGDGASNLLEYAAGTDPGDARSRLAIASTELSAGNLTVSFPTVLGRFYCLEKATSLSGPWSTVLDHLGGTGGMVTAAAGEVAGEAVVFFRVGVLP